MKQNKCTTPRTLWQSEDESSSANSSWGLCFSLWEQKPLLWPSPFLWVSKYFFPEGSLFFVASLYCFFFFLKTEAFYLSFTDSLSFFSFRIFLPILSPNSLFFWKTLFWGFLEAYLIFPEKSSSLSLSIPCFFLLPPSLFLFLTFS